MTGWSPLWSREPVGKAKIDQKDVHGGRHSVRIEHAGEPRLEPQPETLD